MPRANSALGKQQKQRHEPFPPEAAGTITNPLLSCERLRRSVCVLNRDSPGEEYLQQPQERLQTPQAGRKESLNAHFKEKKKNQFSSGLLCVFFFCEDQDALCAFCISWSFASCDKM